MFNFDGIFVSIMKQSTTKLSPRAWKLLINNCETCASNGIGISLNTISHFTEWVESNINIFPTEWIFVHLQNNWGANFSLFNLFERWMSLRVARVTLRVERVSATRVYTHTDSRHVRNARLCDVHFPSASRPEVSSLSPNWGFPLSLSFSFHLSSPNPTLRLPRSFYYIRCLNATRSLFLFLCHMERMRLLTQWFRRTPNTSGLC